MDVGRVTMTAFLFSGALGGLAGAVEILGNQFALLENFSPGWGYTGIAVALLGGVHAWGCVVAGAFFGILGSGADIMQYRLGVPAAFVLVVEAVAVVFVLASASLRELAAAAYSRRRRTPPEPLPAAPALGSEE
jgi:simple sugar transport system permease protein